MTTLRLAGISTAVAPGAQGVLVPDGAVWHQSGGKLRVPDITLLHLPPCSPELNPVETVWAHLRSNMLSNRVFDTCDDITLACSDAWNWLAAQPDRVTSTRTRTRTWAWAWAWAWACVTQ